MQSITAQCKSLDEEYQDLVHHINGMLDNISSVSLEFVNSKICFLEKYSQTLKSTQLDARTHRNHQIKNLIEYVKLHTRSKVKSVFQSPIKYAHKAKYSFNEKALQAIQYQSQPQIVLTQQDECQDQQIRKKKNDSVRNVLADLINRQKKEQRGGAENMFRFLQKTMKLLESHKIHYKTEFDQLNAEYQGILLNNKSLHAKTKLQAQSSQIKENIHSLIQSQQSFQSYLNSVI